MKIDKNLLFEDSDNPYKELSKKDSNYWEKYKATKVNTKANTDNIDKAKMFGAGAATGAVVGAGAGYAAGKYGEKIKGMLRGKLLPKKKDS